jgi:hypothetical protein
MPILVQNLCFHSMYATVLRPAGRLVAWLEGAARLGLPEGQVMIEQSAGLVKHALPYVDQPQVPSEPAAGYQLVTAEQWKEGALQLQREVSHCLLM